MKKSFSLPPHRPNQPERSPEYPVKLMQHQDPAQLGYRINQIIVRSSDAEMLQQIAQTLGEAFQVECCLVMIKAEEQETAHGCWYSNHNSVLPPPEQLIAMMQKGSEPLVIDDTNAAGINGLAEWQLSPSGQAILQIPTWFQAKINGVISLVRSQPYDWSELEKQTAKAVAASVAIAISQVEQTRLLTSLQQQLHNSTEYKNLLKRIATASRSSLEVNQILQMAIASTAQTLQVERGLILMLKYADPLLKTRSREKIPKAKATVVCERTNDSNLSGPENHSNSSTLLNQSFWISECLLCQQAFTNSPSPVVISAQHDQPELKLAKAIAPIFDFTLLPSLLMLPLESQGTVLGFLVLQHSSDRRWHQEEIALVELISTQLSTAIIQSQTLRQVQSLVEERTTQLQRSLEVQGKLYEKTRQQIDQMRQLNQLKDEFLSTMSHELRTPLTNISLAIRMLRQPGISAERQVKYLDILEQQCTQEINLINDLLKLQQLESQQATLKLETIDIKAKIHDLAQAFEQKWADKGLTITVDLPKTSLLVQTDVESFERILQELLTNAGKYSDPDTNVVLRVTNQVNQQIHQTVITLTNIGSGISSEEANYIFDKFRRGQGVTQNAIQGTGLGLALVKCLVHHLNGTIDVASSAISNSSSYETCFTLTLS